MKKIFLIFVFLLAIFLGIDHAQAQENDKITIHLFYGDGCPHCANEEAFLEQLILGDDSYELKKYEVWHNSENLKLMQEVGNRLNAKVSGVPFTVIGERYVSGYLSDDTTGAEILDLIRCHRETGCEDAVEAVIDRDGSDNQLDVEKKNKIPENISLPIIGEINIKNYSLGGLAVVLGVLDGFNPCAMWVLLFLITLLMNMKNKKRMWILGSVFIVSSAVVYFLFMGAWLNLLIFLGMIVWVRYLVGLVALGGGIYNVREFFVNKNATCKVSNTDKGKNVAEGLKKYVYEKNFWLAIGGIIILAFSVNLIEAVCSAGIPVIFTQILTLSDLPTWKYYLYILIYIFFFMIDDLIVFVIAMVTLRLTGITIKYTRFSHIVGGILMLIIGVLMIFKPSWLMFG